MNDEAPRNGMRIHFSDGTSLTFSFPPQRANQASIPFTAIGSVWIGAMVTPVAVTGPGVLDVTFWRQKASLTVHLVNLTNPMMMKGPVRELIPVGKQQVRVRLPDGMRAKQVRLLVSGQSPRTERSGRYLRVTVPAILDHEVVAIDV